MTVAAAGMHFFPFADGGTLFYPGNNRLWVLNRTSALIWCLRDEGRSASEVAAYLVARYGIAADVARRDVTSAEALFRDENLLTPDRLPPSPANESFLLPPAASAPAETAAFPRAWQFRTPGQRFTFACAGDFPGESFALTLAPLLAPGDGAAGVHLAVQPATASGRWDIHLDGKRWLADVPSNAVAPHLLKVVFVRACEALADHLLFHAAVLGRAAAAVLFPAEAGSGKTTLAATLAARGHRFFSDELAVLERRTLEVRALPLPMSIKPGSVDVLAGAYPELPTAAVHWRSDGQKVRYLAPPAGSAVPGDAAAGIEALVFPRYEPNAATTLHPLDGPAALQRLAATGSSNRPLTAADVKAMVALVEGVPAFSLVFSAATAAAQLLEKHFTAFSPPPAIK